MRAPTLSTLTRGLLCAALALPLLAHAQSAEERRLQMTRDALREAQSALQAARNKEATLSRENAELKAERDRLADEAKGQAGRVQAARAQAERTAAESARHAEEAEGLRTTLRATQEQLAQSRERERELTQRALAAEATVRERQQANQGLTRLLERAVQDLTQSETRNREMHAAAQRILDAYRETGRDHERVIGLEQVAVESRAEALRQALDAQRTPAPAPAR